MGSGTTPLRARPYPLISDAPTVSADLEALAVNLDTVANLSSGTTLPITGMVDGDEFRNTTTGQWFKYNGSAWYPMLVAGAWTALTLTSGLECFTAGEPAARLIGDTIEFCGIIGNASATIVNSSQIGTVPSGMAPATGRTLNTSYRSPSGVPSSAAVDVYNSTGNILFISPTAWAINGTVSLDGLSYRLD